MEGRRLGGLPYRVFPSRDLFLRESRFFGDKGPRHFCAVSTCATPCGRVGIESQAQRDKRFAVDGVSCRINRDKIVEVNGLLAGVFGRFFPSLDDGLGYSDGCGDLAAAYDSRHLAATKSATFSPRSSSRIETNAAVIERLLMHRSSFCIEFEACVE